MRCCPATPPTRRRCGVFSSGSSGNTARLVGLADGSRRADRGGARRDARCRPAGALPGGHAEGPPDALGEASDHSALAAGATRRAEPAPAKAGVKLLAQEGELYVLAQSRDRVAKELAIRPVFHQLEARIEAHVFIAFLAYCLHVTLARRLHALAPGLTPRSVLQKFAAVQMIDVHLPTTDGRELVLTRYTEPEPELSLLLKKLKLELPAQPPPKITASAPAPPTSM